MSLLRKKILGLDIGHRSLKGILLSKRGSEVVLEDYFYIDLRQSLDDGGSDPGLSSLVKAVIDGRGLRNRLVAASLEDRELALSIFTLPSMPENEIRSAVLNKLEAMLGKSLEEFSVDYTIAAPGGEGTRVNVAELEVIAYYAKLAAVQSRLSLLQEAELRPFSMECSLHAALEAARFNGYIPQEEACLLVDVGDAHTSVGLISRGELIQINSIRVGAGDINQNLMKQFECSFEESELRKLGYQLEKEESSSADPATKAIEEGYFRIIVAIHDTVTYLKAARKSLVINSVVLSGGGLLKEGAVDLIQQSLGLPVTFMDPLRKIQIYGKDKNDNREELPRIGPMLQVAVGLALRGVA